MVVIRMQRLALVCLGSHHLMLALAGRFMPLNHGLLDSGTCGFMLPINSRPLWVWIELH